MEGSGWEKKRSKKSYNAARFSSYFVVSRAFGYNVFFFQQPDGGVWFQQVLAVKMKSDKR